MINVLLIMLLGAIVALMWLAVIGIAYTLYTNIRNR